MKKAIPKEFKINIKLKLAVLWTSVTFLYIYGDYFELYVPGKTAGLINGDNLLGSPLKLFLGALLLAIPSVMICLSVLLKSTASKWLNIVFGTFFTVIMLLIAVTSVSEWRAFYVFYAIMESVLSSIIVWHAVKWPKQIQMK